MDEDEKEILSEAPTRPSSAWAATERSTPRTNSRLGRARVDVRGVRSSSGQRHVQGGRRRALRHVRRDIHSANPLARRHERFPVIPFYDSAAAAKSTTASRSGLGPDDQRKPGSDTPILSATCRDDKILVANRGEIAVRVIRTAHEMGIPCVAVYSTIDKDALRVKLADESVCIGEAPSSQSYLVVPNVLSDAISRGCTMLHPGYGFLSENAVFVEMCSLEEVVMCMVSIISSVDSVGSYYASSLLVASRPPTPGVLSRGIGLEGLTSILAGLWGNWNWVHDSNRKCAYYCCYENGKPQIS